MIYLHSYQSRAHVQMGRVGEQCRTFLGVWRVTPYTDEMDGEFVYPTESTRTGGMGGGGSCGYGSGGGHGAAHRSSYDNEPGKPRLQEIG